LLQVQETGYGSKEEGPYSADYHPAGADANSLCSGDTYPDAHVYSDGDTYTGANCDGHSHTNG